MDINNAKNYILEYLSINRVCISLFKIKAIIPREILERENFDLVLSELMESGNIVYTPQGIALKPTSLGSLIDHVSDKKVREALLLYFRGDKVETFGVQEIKVIVRGFLSERPRLDEDEFRGLFRTYRFTQKSFTTIFSQPISTYIYLKETSKKGKKDWRELRYDLAVEEKYKLETIRLIRGEGLYIEDRIIPFSVGDLASYLLSKHNTNIHYKELYLEYTHFIEKKRRFHQG